LPAARRTRAKEEGGGIPSGLLECLRERKIFLGDAYAREGSAKELSKNSTFWVRY